MEWSIIVWMGSTTLLLIVSTWRMRRLEKMIEDHPTETDYSADGPQKIDGAANCAPTGLDAENNHMDALQQ